MKLLPILLALTFAQPALADILSIRLAVINKEGEALKVSVTPPAEKQRREVKIFTIPEVVAYFRDLVIAYDGAWVKIQRAGVPYRKLLPVLRSIQRNHYVRMTSVDEKKVDLAELIKTIEPDGARQPATAPESKSEGVEKPRSESEGRAQ